MQNGMRVEQVVVTPAMAGEWLTRNPHNRFPSEKRVRRYARDMQNGAWMLTHQPIAFDTEGDILDGQQRLLAIQRSNTSQPFLVVRGAKRETFYLVDTGKPRSLADAFTIMGEPSARQMSAVVNLSFRITEGRDEFGTPLSSNPSTVRALEYFNGHAQPIREATKVGGHVYYYLRGPHSAYGGVYHPLSGLSIEDADWFMDHLATGHSLNEGHPVGTLRNHIISLVREVPKTVDRLYVAALMIKGWNAYRDGKELYQLTFRPGGARPEPFPVPK